MNDGSLYIGEWDRKTDTFDGFGVMVSVADGSVHQGYWSNGKPYGKGIHFFGKGPFEGDRLESDFGSGRGTIHHRDGRTYTGDISNSSKSGKGEEIFPDG